MRGTLQITDTMFPYLGSYLAERLPEADTQRLLGEMEERFQSMLVNADFRGNK